MSLTERIERRQPNPNIVPLVERRGGTERRLPEWRRRAIADLEQRGFVAVTDLTERAA